MSVVVIIGGFQVAVFGGGLSRARQRAGGGAAGTGVGVGRHGHVDAHALGDHNIDFAAGIDFNHRKRVLGELDVVLGQAVQGLADTGADACAVGVTAAATVAGDRAQGRGAVGGR